MRTTRFGVLSVLVVLSLFLQASATTSLTTQNGMVTISGRVVDSGGRPADVLIDVVSSDWEDMGIILVTDRTGAYRLEVPARDGYILWFKSHGEAVIGEVYFPAGLLEQYVYVTPVDGQAVVDVVLQPGGTLWLQTYTPQAEYVFTEDKFSSWNVGVYPLGALPADATVTYANRQGGLALGWQEGSDKTHPAMFVTADAPVELWVHWPVPEVGDTFIRLDNDGRGYIVARGQVLPINVLYEAARTEKRLFAARMSDYRAQGYAFDDAVTVREAAAAAALEILNSTCPAGDLETCIPAAYDVLTAVLRAREEAVLQVAQQDIETYRKADVSLQVLTCDGTPLPGAQVGFWQTGHDFMFAAGWPEASQVQPLLEAGFNSAAGGGFWHEVLFEPDPAMIDFMDQMYWPMRMRGMKLVMHTGWWFIDEIYPDFFAEMSLPERLDLAYQFSYRTAQHYAKDTLIYNALNEPQGGAFQLTGFSLQEMVDFAAASVRGANDGAPGLPTYINFYNHYLSEFGWTPNPANLINPLPDEIIRALLAAGVPFDQIGLEYYQGVVAPTIDIGLFNDSLEYFSGYGLPIFISELSYGTTDDLTPYLIEQKPWYRNGWHAGHSEQTQAEYAVYTYTVAFSKPYVSGVMWVSASELPAGEPYSGDGLFNEDESPRPIVAALGDLIGSWTTSGQGETGAGGVLTWRGFTGEYAITWQEAGVERSAVIQVTRNGPNEFVVGLDGCAQVTPTSVPASVPVASTRAWIPIVALTALAVAVGLLLAVRRRK